ncbi:phenylalanine--tRNA ligase subunit beta [Phocicoccus pinnipedialis]|uniref:Phenylalanine--tRNA ligase beta subunit n=1 Tax=Phocicoccus pinnipedialis TaxID=110845 RepID=A0A6V7RCL1_9BACL|nr:phenylalanine--tRNA ligase subunit beta [Jeotgalicoccus pinnipedialis]MBP1939473.1 phenylalanyl-tRNA synthetase beta chain [Jeotgalicoccus pinnipedialis]CAD2075254.1 Phenylalanine--tRNA ligase beta subunit [Jeotgalicoccus pinnipedialis]
MRVSKEWLETFISVDADTETLAETITRGGIEVDDIIDYTKDIKNLVIGYVAHVKQHPEANKLKLCQVNTGDETVQIVCGAPNVKADSYVIVSKVGGRLPGGIKIKKAKLRGEESYGMICSLEEIGISEDFIPEEFKDGIFIFNEEQTPGTNALEALYLDDQVLEFDLTPNRKDALSMIGTAYEVRALFGGEVIEPKRDMTETDDISGISVKNEDSEAVPFYALRKVNNVKIMPSPVWMQHRLLKAGIRPINNVVDISNYVLLEFGQPLHIFDYDNLGSKEIVTRRAKKDEKMTTLDGKERTLLESDIVITNGKEPVALAGVMGGDFSEVTDNTTNVVIESALFEPVSIRKTSGRLNLRSEASSRFEKGVSHEFVLKALDRTAYLLETLAGGTVEKGIVSDGALDLTPTEIDTSVSFINNRLGLDLNADEITETLDKLGIDVKLDGDNIHAIIPSRRDDLKIPEDITEEVARIYGYDNLPSTLPVYSEITPGRLTDNQVKTRVIKKQLSSLGLSGAINYALTEESRVKEFTNASEGLKLKMPMSEIHSTLRTSLIPHLVDNVTYNMNRQRKSVSLYEMGKVFETHGQDKLPTEITKLAAVISGPQYHVEWLGASLSPDFYTLKGILESVFTRLSLKPHVTYERTTEYAELHPGRTAHVLLKGKVIGLIGELHPKYAKDHDLNQTTVFEVNLDEMYKETEGTIRYEQLPKYPQITRDIALEVNSEVTVQDIIDLIYKQNVKHLINVEPFDVYEGEHIEAGKKSVALHLTYLNKEETLTDEIVETLHAPIVDALLAEGFKIRA